MSEGEGCSGPNMCSEGTNQNGHGNDATLMVHRTPLAERGQGVGMRSEQDRGLGTQAGMLSAPGQQHQQQRMSLAARRTSTRAVINILAMAHSPRGPSCPGGLAEPRDQDNAVDEYKIRDEARDPPVTKVPKP
jgi:hypothetical protein